MSIWKFKRHLDDAFVGALIKAREENGWWSEVVRDPDLIIALRGDYLNVYYQGQSIFKVWNSGNGLAASTHPKYLLDPALCGQISFDGSKFNLGNLAAKAVLNEWNPNALQRLKKTAKNYSGTEKQGCHAAVIKSERLLDVEIAFSRDPETLKEDERKIPRIDLAMLESQGDGYRVQFWEAKAFGNPELGSMSSRIDHLTANPHRAVFDQLDDYEKIIASHAEELRESYALLCKNLSDIYRETGRYPPGSSVGRVASDASLLHSVSPKANLLLFGFDDAQKKDSKSAFAHLNERISKDRVRIIGKAKGAFAH